MHLPSFIGSMHLALGLSALSTRAEATAALHRAEVRSRSFPPPLALIEHAVLTVRRSLQPRRTIFNSSASSALWLLGCEVLINRGNKTAATCIYLHTRRGRYQPQSHHHFAVCQAPPRCQRSEHEPRPWPRWAAGRHSWRNETIALMG